MRTTVPIDTLRDAQATALAASCDRSGYDATPRETVAGSIFDELLMSCDLRAQGEIGVFLAVGLRDGYAWSLIAASPRRDFDRNTCRCATGNVETVFLPMVHSLDIYDSPVASIPVALSAKTAWSGNDAGR